MRNLDCQFLSTLSKSTADWRIYFIKTCPSIILAVCISLSEVEKLLVFRKFHGNLFKMARQVFESSWVAPPPHLYSPLVSSPTHVLSGDCHECHPGCRQVPGVLWQLPPADHSRPNPSCGDLLHPRTRARLPGGGHSHSHPDSHVRRGRRRLPALPHWSRGTICLTSRLRPFGRSSIMVLMNPKTETLLCFLRKLMRPANG